MSWSAYLSFFSRFTDARLPSIAFCVALGCTAFFGLKRRLIYIGLIIVVRFVAIALNGAGMLLSEVSEEPEVALEPVAISVCPLWRCLSYKNLA